MECFESVEKMFAMVSKIIPSSVHGCDDDKC